MISDITLLLIKQFVKQKRYRMLYNEDDNPKAGEKMREYIDKLGLPEHIVVEKVTDSLTAVKGREDKDDNPRYEKTGMMYIFTTQCFGDELYVKYKILEPPDFTLLVFSIHPAEH